MKQIDVRRLYTLHGQELRHYLAGRLNCAHTAEDLTQETFSRLLNRQSTDTIKNPRAYLYRIASNLVTDHFRRLRYAPLAVEMDVAEAVQDEAPGPERTLLARDELRCLERAVAELPPRQREILLLHKFEGYSYSIIAECLGISKNTVMVHMIRALARCRDLLEKEE